MIENLAIGITSTSKGDHVAARIDGFVVDLLALSREGGLPRKHLGDEIFAANDLNPFMNMGQAYHLDVYAALSELRDKALDRLAHFRVPAGQTKLKKPLSPGDFVDFYANRYHAARSAKLTENPDFLPEAWEWMPLAYHARTSSIIGNGSEIVRPSGWTKGPGGWAHRLTHMLDFEVELGFVMRRATDMGERLAPEDFDDAVFGAVLVTDWSARDLQGAEAKPLGPFHSKAFATQIGDWVVPIEVLKTAKRDAGLLRPDGRQPIKGCLFDIAFEVDIRSATGAWTTIASTNLADMAWTPAELMAHLTQSGAPVRVGDLFATGTVSGPTPTTLGCLVERQAEELGPFVLGEDQSRHFLHDGDALRITASLDMDGHRVLFDKLEGTIAPATLKLELVP